MKLTNSIGMQLVNLHYYQYLAAFTATLNMVCSGMHYGWASPSLPQLLDAKSSIPTTDAEGSWIVVMFLLGGFVGALLSSVILDRIGRKNVILLSSVPFFASWMLLAFAGSVAVLLVGRFVAGIADGLMFCSIPVYIGEIAESKIRGLLGSAIVVTWIFGILFINTIGAFLSIRDTALICSALPLIVLATFVWMPASPYFLIMKEKFDKARKNLSVLRGGSDVEQEFNRLVKAVEQQRSSTGKWLDLFTVRSNRRALYVMMGTRAAQHFSGFSPIMFYSQIIFKESGDAISPSTGSIIYFGTQLLAATLSSTIVDRTGRKPLMIFAISGASLALLTQSCYLLVQNNGGDKTFSWISIVALLVFVVVFSIGMQTIPVLLLGEIFPTSVKAFALCFADIYVNLIATIISKFFQITKDAFGMHVPFFVFTFTSIIGLLFVIFYVPETKGKTLEEIQEGFKNSNRSIKTSDSISEENTLSVL